MSGTPPPLPRVTLAAMPSFTTDDGSSIRELAGPQPRSGPSAHQPLAAPTVAPGGATAEHFHERSEEIYYVTAGAGRMRLGDAEGLIGPGDCVVIAPGTPHKLWCEGPEPLRLLCCCAPPYSPGDTVLTGR